MLLRFLVTLIAQDERIRRMGPRALLLLISGRGRRRGLLVDEEPGRQLAAGGTGNSGPVGVYRLPTVARSH